MVFDLSAVYRGWDRGEFDRPALVIMPNEEGLGYHAEGRWEADWSIRG